MHLRFVVFGAAVGLALLPSQEVRADRTPLTSSLTSVGFRLLTRKKGVTVYKHPRTSLVRLAAEGTIAQPVDRVRRALLDYPRHVGLVGRVAEARILKRGGSWMVVYQRFDLPVISDRDFTLFVKTGHTGKTQWITYRAVTNRGPAERKGIVRVSLHRGSWQLRPVQGGRATFARFQLVIDLAGTLPRWMSKGEAGMDIPDLFGQMEKLAAGYGTTAQAH